MALRVSFLIAALVVLGSVSTVDTVADEFQLRSGGVVEGTLIEESTVDGEVIYVIETASGAQLTLPKMSVRRIVAEPEEMTLYRERATNVADTPASHWEMAELCLELRLTKQREYHLWQIIRLDPDHEDARRGLGFSRLKGRWMTQDQYMRSQGYIRDGNAWRLPQEIAINEQREAREQIEIEWRRKIRTWADWIGNRRHAEALENFRQVDDPAALSALTELLAEANTVAAKRLLIDTLEQINSPAIVGPLSAHYLLEDDDDIREMCLRLIKEHADPLAPRYFMAHLDPAKSNPIVINRAGRALEVLEADEAIRSLIEALVTEHTAKVGGNSGGGQDINFGSGGPNGGIGSFQVGGNQQRTITHYSENTAVLAALQALTQSNYGFDQESWRGWYVESNSHPNVNLRRSIE